MPDALDLGVLKIQLKELLKTVPKYTLQLRNLEDCLNTLDIHTRNYQLKLKRLQSAVNDELDLFNRFAERESETFQLQIQADLNYSKPGAQLLDQAISSIRGLVEIDQAESDRKLQETLNIKENREKEKDLNLQITIAVVGVGIGVAGVVSSSYTLAVDKRWDFPSPQHPLLWPHPFFMAIIISCLCGGIFGGVAFLTARKLLIKPSSVEAISPSPENQPPSD